jgi:protoporphyrinogen oxidase
VRRVGAEQEMFLVDSSMRPAPLAAEVISRIADARLTTEIARFNLEAILGILFNSSSFEGRVHEEGRCASFTILLGGPARPEWVSATDDEIAAAVRAELAELLGIGGEPLERSSRAGRAPYRSTRTGLPELWRVTRETWCAAPGRMLFGNYTGQVSLRGMIEKSREL